MTPGRFLFVTWSGGGNVPPAIALARQLTDRGHTVAFIASTELEQRVRAAGFEFRAFRSLPPLNAELSVEQQGAHVAQVLAGAHVAKDLLAEVDRERPDVLVIDCMQFNALSAAEVCGIPTAVFVHLLYEPWRMRPGLGEMLKGFIDETRAELGLSPLTSDLVVGQLWDAPAAAIVVTPKEFDFACDSLPANVRYVGPIIDRPADTDADLPWPEDDTAPLALVSFSSTYMNQEEAIMRATAAVASTGARCLLTLGESIKADAVTVPEGVIVRQWIPHAAVLPRAGLVLTHAGHATVMAALAHGVPLVCMPMGRDQFANADRVEAIGAGRQSPIDSSVEQIAEAVADVLKNETYRDGAKRMRDVIARYDNGSHAVRELEALLRG